MKNQYIVATAGEFTGQTGRVLASHTYPEIGLHYSVRFPTGSLWIPAKDVRLATNAERLAVERSLTLRPAA
ncbi:hypothetical protein [Opitutus sp. ER46]|uniref:hypothetical protein n=1 Tax=Opitutus sp. ER46 TaxID=2161864 RepID=UPI000D31B667|nr:hypothetical protein [Opitutus sp. ER46]PTX98584.1 hypothetical protein DB354_04790 [Opitutus sp. ER46]